MNPQPLDLHSNALSTELSQHSVASLNRHGLYSHALLIPEIISPTRELVHETKLTSEISCPTDSCLAQLVELDRNFPVNFIVQWVEFFLRKDYCIWTCYLLCKMRTCYLSVRKTRVTGRIFKFMLQWLSDYPEFNETSVSFSKNSIHSEQFEMRENEEGRKRHFWHYKYQSLCHFILLNIKQIDYNIQQLPHVCFLQATLRMFKVLQCQNK